MLGLLALGWCLLVAPLLHRFVHAHGVDHTHQAGGSFEHQDLHFTAPPQLPALAALVYPVVQPGLTRPTAPTLRAARPVAQPQAP